MLKKISPDSMPLDRFEANLHAVCGAFEVVGFDERPMVNGFVGTEMRGGMEVATIAKDVHCVRRTKAEISRSNEDNIFLIVQEEGQSLMQQAGRAILMAPGDMILIDSNHPSEFTFFGKYSRHLSIHLEREDMTSRFRDVDFRAHGIRRSDMNAIALTAILTKAFDPKTTEVQTGFLKEAVFGLLGASFYEARGHESARAIETDVASAQILERSIAYIDRGFSDRDLTPRHLAAALGVSLRQLQRAFALSGMTPSDYILKKRLEKACRLLDARATGLDRSLISTIAYRCGFSDASYFNRRFRDAFHCAPSQYVSRH